MNSAMILQVFSVTQMEKSHPLWACSGNRRSYFSVVVKVCVTTPWSPDCVCRLPPSFLHATKSCGIAKSKYCLVSIILTTLPISSSQRGVFRRKLVKSWTLKLVLLDRDCAQHKYDDGFRSFVEIEIWIKNAVFCCYICCKWSSIVMPGDNCSVFGCGTCRRTKGVVIWKLL